jgi:DNA-binding MarR family transcriptional regulator
MIELNELQKLSRDIIHAYRCTTELVIQPITEDMTGCFWGHVFYLWHLYLEGPHTNADLARTFCVSRQAMSLAMGELAEKGLIEYAPNPRHKTARLITLTEEGTALTEKHIRLSATVARKFGEKLGPEAHKALGDARDLLQKVTNVAESYDWEAITREIWKEDEN